MHEQMGCNMPAERIIAASSYANCKTHARKCGGLYAMMLSSCLSICLVGLSPAKFVKSFATWQHLATSGGFLY